MTDASDKSKPSGHRELWLDFVERTYPRVREFEFQDIPIESDRFAVIIEPRPHPHLEYVLRNVMHFLGEGWGLQVFVGQQNRAFVEDLVRDWKYVHIYHLNVDNLSRDEFRRLRKSRWYWESLKGEYQLCFETDSMLCRSGIDEFLRYDYVGAPWSDRIAVSDVVRVGNGGLSLRRKSTMMEICGSAHRGVIPSEDAFFSIHLHLNRDKYRVAPPEVARTFSVESVFYERPLGIHKAWMYLSEQQIEALFAGVEYGSR